MKFFKLMLTAFVCMSMMACVNQAKLQKERELAGGDNGLICRMEQVAGKLIRERICYTPAQIERIREASQNAKDGMDRRDAIATPQG
jgi:hypothetical protein